MSEQTLVPTLLSIITPSSEYGSDEEWELTLRFVDQHRGDDLAEVIFANTPPSTEPWKVGALIDHLVWNISDALLERMMRTVESWLCSEDPRKIGYALAIQYVFPFTNAEKMFAVLGEVKAMWPNFRERCDELINLRRDSRR
jgi:hypothetical protein